MRKLRDKIEKIVQPNSPLRQIIFKIVIIFFGILLMIGLFINLVIFNKAGLF